MHWKRWLLISILSFTAIPARAQDNSPAHKRAPRPSDEKTAASKDAYEQGLRLYNVGEYEKALELFKRAYLHRALPVFLFNVGQCQRQLGQYDAAEKSYRAFLRESTDVNAAERANVQRLIETVHEAAENAVAKQPPMGNHPDDQVGKPETTTPPPAEATTGTSSGAGAGTVEAARPAPRPWYKDPAGMTLGIGGLALVAVGGGLLGKALSDDGSARDAATLPDQRRFTDSAQGFATGGWVLVGVGGAALVSGVVILSLKGARK